jgi:predicted Fe-S protein YdhL (DUF1289 family)
MGDADPTDLHGQEQARIERESRDKLGQRREAEDLKWLMSSARGRRIVWRLLERAGVFRSTFSATAMVMAFNEGQRNQGNVFLTEVMTHCPDRFLEMLTEQRKHDDRNADDGRGASH